MKLYPALYVLVFGVLIHRLIRPGDQSLADIVYPAIHDLFFVQSYLPGTYGHFWSLSVEEHFYVLLPVALYLMLRLTRADDPDPFRKIPLCFAAVAAFCLATRLIHAALVQPYNYLTHLFYTHFRLDSLMFGVLLSYWYRFRSRHFDAFMDRFGSYLLPLSLLLILPAFIWEQSDFFTYTVGLTTLYLGYGGLMIALLRISIPGGFLTGLLRPFSYIGQHSYPIYLFHVPLTYQLRQAGLLKGWAGVALYFVASMALGILVSKLIEFPVLYLRDRIFPPVVKADLPAAAGAA